MADIKKTLAGHLRQWLKTHTLNGRQFRVMILIGQKRSGNHVFLNWYMSQCTGTCFLFNNVSPDQTPTERRRQELRIKLSHEVPTLIFSYEDHSAEAVFAGPLATFLNTYAGQITDTTLCMVLRDPRNLIASRIKKWPEEFANPDRLVDVRNRYVQAAQIILSPPPKVFGQRFVPVLYNALIKSGAYRDRLSDLLGIQTGTRGLDQVANYGHGSSFDGQDKTGRASEMDVFARWTAFEEDMRFKTIFEDKAMSRTVTDFEDTMTRIASSS